MLLRSSRWTCGLVVGLLLVACGDPVVQVPTADGGDGGPPSIDLVDAGSNEDAGLPDAGPGADVDTDCDGLRDVDEPALGTDPGRRDTDGDGLSDGVELGRASSDAGCVFSGDADPGTQTNPTLADSDGDGLADGVEDANRDGRVDSGETDPNVADSDGDGCRDGLEDADGDGVVDATETDPRQRDCGTFFMRDSDQDGLQDTLEDATGTNKNAADTDADGLPDGLEDANGNGRVDPGETNPRRRDTDCDGLADGPTMGATLGEDLDADGVVDASETNPLNADSDGDGLRDGLERGVAINLDPAVCVQFVPDEGPTTTTDPTRADTDGDGLADGIEDADHDGQVDGLELDPNDANDPTSLTGRACAPARLRSVSWSEDSAPDLQLGLPTSFAELHPMLVGSSRRGVIGYDDTNKVAFFVYRGPAPGAATSATAAEANVRTLLNAELASTQTFPTWDGFSAVQSFYEQPGSVDLKARANALAEVLVGAGAGALTGAAGETGPFKLQLQVVYRSSASVVVLLAMTPLARFVPPGLFTVEDVAGGSAVAQFGDATVPRCDTLQPASAQVDFLFVVDNSGSMAGAHQSLSDLGTELAATLGRSQLDWRMAMVTSEYDRAGNAFQFREFTSNMNQVRAWLAQNSVCQASGQCSVVSIPAGTSPTSCVDNSDCWINIAGLGVENGLMALARAVDYVTRPGGSPAQTVKRPGARLVTIFVGDADDQSSATLAQLTSFFTTLNATVSNPNAGGETYVNRIGPIVVHGIVCPDGATCSETQASPRKNAGVFAATGGLRGSIESTTAVQRTMRAIIDASIRSAGQPLTAPPIGASLRVAMSAVEDETLCDKNDLPRSRVHGFDLAGATPTLTLYGACRPPSGTAVQAVALYRAWVERTPNADGNPAPCSADAAFDASATDSCRGALQCDRATSSCRCPADCGGVAPASMVCNNQPTVCGFVCEPDCGGRCGAWQACNATSCTCECAQNATCAPGLAFVNDGVRCGCF